MDVGKSSFSGMVFTIGGLHGAGLGDCWMRGNQLIWICSCSMILYMRERL